MCEDVRVCVRGVLAKLCQGRGNVPCDVQNVEAKIEVLTVEMADSEV